MLTVSQAPWRFNFQPNQTMASTKPEAAMIPENVPAQSQHTTATVAVRLAMSEKTSSPYWARSLATSMPAEMPSMEAMIIPSTVGGTVVTRPTVTISKHISGNARILRQPRD